MRARTRGQTEEDEDEEQVSMMKKRGGEREEEHGRTASSCTEEKPKVQTGRGRTRYTKPALAFYSAPESNQGEGQCSPSDVDSDD